DGGPQHAGDDGGIVDGDAVEDRRVGAIELEYSALAVGDVEAVPVNDGASARLIDGQQVAAGDNVGGPVGHDAAGRVGKRAGHAEKENTRGRYPESPADYRLHSHIHTKKFGNNCGRFIRLRKEG